MNRYVVRALVAVLTFSIGVVVGLGPRRSRHKCHDHAYARRVFQVEAPPSYRGQSFRGPFLSIDTTQNDPLKLTYASTTTDPTFSNRQHVEFLVNNTAGRAISNYTISYLSAAGQYHRANVFFRSAPKSEAFEPISLECEVNETLIVWVSAVEFKDGTQWENPRHKSGQKNL